jgi:hypothetical protein
LSRRCGGNLVGDVIVLGDALDHAENMARWRGDAIIESPQGGANRRLASVEGRRSGDYLLWLG